MNLKLIRRAAWLCVGLAGLALFVVTSTDLSTAGRPGSVTQPQIGGPFRLTSHKGEIFDSARLAGRPFLVFFGFTQCPDICPTTLYQLSDLLRSLGRDADRITPIFITVDPERDTQTVLARYMQAFDERIIALRGNKAETDQAVKAFAAYYNKVPLEGGGYTVDHTAGVFLMDATGAFAGTLDLHEPLDNMVTKLKRLASR